MDEIIDALARLRRPPLIIAAISAFSVLAGITFILRPELGANLQGVLGFFLLAAGLSGLALTCIVVNNHTVARVWLAGTGSVIVVSFALRGAGLWEALLFDDLDGAWSYYLVGGAQWIALAYMTMVAWFDVALPWVLSRSR